MKRLIDLGFFSVVLMFACTSTLMAGGLSADTMILSAEVAEPGLIGQPMTYRVTLTNRGPDVATTTTYAQNLDPTMTFVEAAASQGTCGHSGGLVICDLGDLPNSAQVGVYVTVAPSTVGGTSSTVTVGAATPDPDPFGASWVLQASVADTSCGSDWSWRNPTPHAIELKDLEWDGSRFIGVGLGGTVVRTTDGTSWSHENSRTGWPLLGVASDGVRTVAVGERDIIRSFAGSAWNPSANPAWFQLNSVVYNLSVWAAVGTKGEAAYSTDGVTWTHTVTTAGELYDLAWLGNPVNLFTAVGGAGSIFTSPDAITWTDGSLVQFDDFLSIASNPAGFVAVGTGGVIKTSTDGLTWFSATSGTTKTLTSVEWSGSQFVAVGRDGVIITSPAGGTWSPQTSGTTSHLTEVAWGGGRFLAVGEQGVVLASSNGSSWATLSGGDRTTMLGIHFNGTRHVAVGQSGVTMSSFDGAFWTSVGSGAGVTLRDVSYGGASTQTFVAVGDGGTIVTSTDGSAWTPRASGLTKDLFDVEWSGSTFVAVGGAATTTPAVLTSPDGLAWTPRTSTSTTGFEGLAWGGTTTPTFVAVGVNTVETSPDGVAWTARAFPGGFQYFTSVAWSGPLSLFVAIGQHGIITSSDGVTWVSVVNFINGEVFRSITWGADRFLAVGESALFNGPASVLTSTDGLTWQRRTTGESFRLLSVAFNDTSFVAAGVSGAILTSDPCLGADIRVIKTDSLDPVNNGEVFTYDITVFNDGPDVATGVVMSDFLPVGIQYLGAAVTQGGPCVSVTATSVSCPFGSIGASASATATLTVVPTQAGQFVNMVNALANEPDPDTSNNEASEATTVNASADLSLIQADVFDPVTIGDTVTYTVTITNNGVDQATAVTLVDTLPASVVFSSAVPSQGSGCSENAGTVTCDLGSLANQALAFVFISGVTTQTGSISNFVQVSASENDPQMSDNSATEFTTVDPVQTDLGVIKSDSPDPVVAGSNLTYTIVVSNNGPETATNVIMNDFLPTEVTFSSAQTNPPGGLCIDSLGILDCSFGSLASGSSVTITVVTVPLREGLISNTATVSSDLPDPVGSNDGAIENTTVELALIVEPLEVGILEGSSNTFGVKLSGEPIGSVLVSSSRTAGDTDISVTAGGALTFDGIDWSIVQDVTLSAAVDGDLIDGIATVTVSSAGLPSVLVTATEKEFSIFADGFESGGVSVWSASVP